MNWNRIKVGVITLIFVLLINWIFSLSSVLYNVLYFKSVFQVLRVLHDYTLGLLPLPSIYIIAPFFIGYFFLFKQKSRFWWLESVISCLIWIIIAFYLTWGFNYQQPSIYSLTKLNPVILDSAYITKTFRKQTDLLDSLLNMHLNLSVKGPLDKLESQLRINQEGIISKWGIPTFGRVRVRPMFKGSLLHIRTSGVYIPHAFEGHLDSGLYELQYPFTMAHEMAHGYGFTDESVCNFISYITCIQSSRPEVIFSAELAYWRYLAGYYRYFHSESWKEEYDNLSPKIIYHLNQISEHADQYKDWMPKYRDIIYDNYLKSHGVKAGIRSYSQMILLIAAYREDDFDAN